MKVKDILERLQKVNPEREIWLELFEPKKCPTCGSSDELKYYGPAGVTYPINHGREDTKVFVISGYTE